MPRPPGFDYNVPDPEGWRCEVCNPRGMNRTGLTTYEWCGNSTTAAYGWPCRSCWNGIKPEIAQELGL